MFGVVLLLAAISLIMAVAAAFPNAPGWLVHVAVVILSVAVMVSSGLASGAIKAA